MPMTVYASELVAPPTDFDQLLGTLKALEQLERDIAALKWRKNRLMRWGLTPEKRAQCELLDAEVDELNARKSWLYGEAEAVGLTPKGVRHLLRLRRRGLCPDDHVPGVYEGLAEAYRRLQYDRIERKRGKRRGNGSDDG